MDLPSFMSTILPTKVQPQDFLMQVTLNSFHFNRFSYFIGFPLILIQQLSRLPHNLNPFLSLGRSWSFVACLYSDIIVGPPLIQITSLILHPNKILLKIANLNLSIILIDALVLLKWHIQQASCCANILFHSFSCQ